MTACATSIIFAKSAHTYEAKQAIELTRACWPLDWETDKKIVEGLFLCVSGPRASAFALN
jgi:hypothetical protein